MNRTAAARISRSYRPATITALLASTDLPTDHPGQTPLTGFAAVLNHFTAPVDFSALPDRTAAFGRPNGATGLDFAHATTSTVGDWTGVVLAGRSGMLNRRSCRVIWTD